MLTVTIRKKKSEEKNWDGGDIILGAFLQNVGALLCHKNAPSGTLAVAKTLILKAALELVEHSSSYSPELVFIDYRLFPKFKEHLH